MEGGRMDASTVIKQKFANVGGEASIPLLRGGTFNARMVRDGIMVDNLSTQPFLLWRVFQEAVDLMGRQSGRAMRGNAMKCLLGEARLPLDSVEGHIASVIYNKKPGEWVFRRVTPIAAILVWAGICRAEPGVLVLEDQ
jgi:hypothetical protein